ncbi:MAG TPA: CopD family protein [Gemmatimonadaceae bacterium]|nr:CopD family protein [Gemmatimonadaceae bacterium]
MPWHYFANVTVHVLAAMTWLGGMLFLGLVGAPVFRAVEPAELRQRLFRDLGLRFRSVGWVAIGILVVTGFGNLYYRGWLRWDDALGSAAFWRTTTGTALAMKTIAVGAMISISAVHDFLQGPAASRLVAGTPEALAARRRAMMLARANALIGVVVVIAAVRLSRS